MTHVPVLIVGAGPTGLTMATELHRHGIAFRIIDKQIKPVSTSNALVAQTRTLEVWNDEGLFENAFSRGNQINAMNIYNKNKKILHAAFDMLSLPHPFVLGIAQKQTESMLSGNLKSKNINIECNVELLDFSEKNSQIFATLKHADGTTENITADYMIACDGGHSIVRSKLNIEFKGKELPQHFVLADAHIKSDLSPNEFHMFISPHGMFMIMQYYQEQTRIIADVTNDPELSEAKSLTYDQVKRLATERCPIPLEISEPFWTSGFWIHERIASTYRYNNIFLAGDAAHVHSPAGGQGMNTGIQDSYNLAWKLALVIKKKARSKILDSYYLERSPVAKGVLKHSTFLTKMMTSQNPVFKTARNLIVFNLFKINLVRKKMLLMLTEIFISYKKSPIVKNAGTLMIGDEGLMNLLKCTEHCILYFSSQRTDMEKFTMFDELIKYKYPDLFKSILITNKTNVSGWKNNWIYDENNALHKQYKITKPTVYFVRPDKYIGYIGPLEREEDFIEYLESIFV